jgi:hypothetical protein
MGVMYQLGLRVQSSGYRVQGSGFMAQGLGFGASPLQWTLGLDRFEHSARPTVHIRNNHIGVVYRFWVTRRQSARQALV